MSGAPPSVIAPPALLGRAEAMRDLLALAAERPGVVVVAGEPGAGTTRLAREAAGRMTLDGAVVVSAEGPGEGGARLERALVAADLGPDPVWAARLRPLVALMGDRAAESDLVARLRRRMEGSRALALVTAREVSPDAPSVLLERLAPAEAAAIAAAASPGLAPEAVDLVTEAGDGLPGRLVPLAIAARRWAGPGAPLPVPASLLDWARRRLAPLAPWPRDLAGWVAVAGAPASAQGLARLCREHPQRIERGLDALVQAGVMEELAGPPLPRWRFRDRLLVACLRLILGGAEVRRRHAAALVAARAEGAGPEELLRLAIGAAQPEAAVGYGVRAAAAARGRGDPAAARALAERALAWWSPEAGDQAARCAALHERGMALLDLSLWTEAAAALEEAAAGRARLGRRDEALTSATAASSARWSIGRHDEALRTLREHLGPGRDGGEPPSSARAEALTQAAGMAVTTSRFGEAAALGARARREARAAGSEEAATRALIFLGMAECGRGRPDGLEHLAAARSEGRRAEGAARRNETLAMIHQSHALLALGRPDEAAACAREGVARAVELGINDHELVLTGNLGEALAAAGELVEARARLERAAAGWTSLARETPSPADPGIAWLLLAEGRLEEALDHYRSLAARVAAEPTPFEQLAPVAVGHALSAAQAGVPAEAAAAVSSALDAWRATDDRLTSIPLLAAAAEVGRGAQARDSVSTLAELAGAGAVLAAPFHAYAEGQLARGRPGEPGAERLRAAAAGFERLGMRWWAARALLAAGSLGESEGEGADDLLAARGAFHEMGAQGWTRRAEARLRAIGRRVPTRARRPAADGAGLSAREREVVEQLALGLRNRDIGQRLFISERTVARHLVQIYSKLGVSTRTAAVRAARERGLLPVDQE